MALIHGEAIDSEKVERIVSREFTAQGFASLCNAIAWASAGQRCSSLPSFTERVYVKDGGIDAEWHTELPDDQPYLSPLLGPGWNVFQYKQRDIFTQDREKIFSSLKSGVKGAIKELHDRTDHRPDRYVLFTNLDLTHETKAKRAADPQKGELKEAILEGYDEPDNVHVEIVAAGELSSFLNNLPHLRSAFFVTSQFQIWQRYWEDFTETKFYGRNIELIGRDDELSLLRTMVDDPNIRSVLLAGPHEIGKTRLALEATSHRPIETVIALDPLSTSVKDLLDLASPGREVVVIIEDPDFERIEQFVKRILPETDLKLLITVPTAEITFLPNFGRDDRIKVIPLAPLSDAQAQELLKAVEAPFDYNLGAWIIEQTGGNPGILLLAVSVGSELRKTARSFTEDVARTLKRKIRNEFSDTTIEILQVLSLLTQIGVREIVSEEIEKTCSLFGGNILPNAILNTLERLAKAGIVRERGAYVEVVPSLLANYFAESALKGRFSEALVLIAILKRDARWRFFQRLRALRGDVVTRFWDELFGVHGLCKDLPSLIANGQLLRVIVGAVPEKVTGLVEEELNRMSIEERLAMSEEDRSTLVHILEDPLFREKTSRGAFRCLLWLAEAEIENSGHDATDLFCECFCFWHPDFPLSLRERLYILDTICLPESSIQHQMLRIKAIRSGLSSGRLIFCRASSGPEPLGFRPAITDRELCHYIETLVDLLLTAAQSKEPELARYADSAIPQALITLTKQIRPESGVARFQIVTDWGVTHKVPISVFKLMNALRHVRHCLNEYIGKCDSDTESSLKKNIEHIEDCINRLNGRDAQGDFSTRLKRWAGGWTIYEHEDVLDEAGNQIPRGKKELKTLAEEVSKNPELLSENLLTWLYSKEASFSHLFFGWLGVLDSKRYWFSKAELIGAHKNGALAFANYCGGVSQTDRQSVITRLGELAETHQVTPEAIVMAMWHLGSEFATVKSMEMLIRDKRIDAAFIEHVLRFEEITSITSNEFLRILKSIVESNLKNAGVLIGFFEIWLRNELPIEDELAEFAWQCLEANPIVSGEIGQVCDQLAAMLAQSDLARGFRLLERLLKQPDESKCWNPIGPSSRYDFWNTLYKVNPEQTLQTILLLALENPFCKANHSFGNVINQECDADVLIAFAYEDEEQAWLISRNITTERPGFWPIAFKIIERYSHSLNIRDALNSGIEQRSWSGPLSVHLENRRESVEQVLNEASTPAFVRPWLEELEVSLRKEAEQWLMSETTEKFNDRKTMPENPAAPERLWAINKLLRLNKIGQLQNLIPKNELLKLLPKLQLSKNELEKIQTKIEAWE